MPESSTSTPLPDAGPAGRRRSRPPRSVSSVTSPSQDATSCSMRWCSRAMSLRLASSTRCRLSFLRAAVHWRPPRSRPRASFSMVCAQPWANASCDSAARSTSPRAASQSARAAPARTPRAACRRRTGAPRCGRTRSLPWGWPPPARRRPPSRRRHGRRAALLGPGTGVVLGRGFQLGHRRRRRAAFAVSAADGFGMGGRRRRPAGRPLGGYERRPRRRCRRCRSAPWGRGYPGGLPGQTTCSIQTWISSGGSGLLNRNPCISVQPSPYNTSCCRVFSTPSATTLRSSAWPAR